MWRNKKQASGYGQRSHSIFAEYLLHCGPGNTISISKRQRLDFGVNSPGKYSLISSVDFAISSLTLCLSKALVGSLCAFSVSMLCCPAILALQLLCAARAVCTALSARVLAGTSRSCSVLLSVTGILAFARLQFEKTQLEQRNKRTNVKH